jgi:ferredoxin
MKIRLDQPRCEGYGLCEDAAPDLMHLDDDSLNLVRRSVLGNYGYQALPVR